MIGWVAQIDAWDTAAAAPTSLRLADRDVEQVCHHDGQRWWPAIAQLPTLRYDFFDGGFGGQISAPTGQMRISVANVPSIAAMSFGDAKVRIWRLDPAATLIFAGRITAQPSVADGMASFELSVDDRWLDKPLLRTYAGTGGAEGPQELTGKAKPLAIGTPRFAPAVAVDLVDLMFQLHDGAIEGVDMAFERVNRYGAPVANYPTFAALKAATIANGAYAACLAEGWVRFGAPPEQPLSFHLRGDKPSAAPRARLPGAIIGRIAQIAGAPAVAAASLAALDAARPWPLSIDITEQTTAREVIQSIAASVNAVAGISWTGALWTRPIGIGEPTFILDERGGALPPVARVQEMPVAAPFSVLSLESERTWLVHGLTEVAFTAALTPRGAYIASVVYREGDIVTTPDGRQWLYVATSPAAGAEPGASPAWDAFGGEGAQGGTIGEDIRLPDGTVPTPEEIITSDGTSKDTNAVAGRPAAQIVADLNFNADTMLSAMLTVDGFQGLVDARTFVMGQPVGTVLLQEINTRETETGALQSTMNLLGAKSADGSAFILNMSGVQTGDGETIGTVLTQLGSVTADHEQQIDFLFSNVVNQDGAESKAVLRVNQDGAIAGLSLTSDGTTGSITFVADEFKVVDPNGGSPVTPFAITNGEVEMPNVTVGRLKYSALVSLLGGDQNRLNPAGGFQIIPGGLILQWGQVRQTINREQSFQVTWPMAFPNACMARVAIPYISTASNLRDLWLQNVGAATPTGAIFFTQAGTDNEHSLQGFDWIAIGH